MIIIKKWGYFPHEIFNQKTRNYPLFFLVDTYMRTKCRRQLEKTKYTLLNSIFDENCPSLVLF